MRSGCESQSSDSPLRIVHGWLATSAAPSPISSVASYGVGDTWTWLHCVVGILAPTREHANTESFLGLFRILCLEMWMRAFQL